MSEVKTSSTKEEKSITLGIDSRGIHLVWNLALSRYDIELRRGKRRLASIRILAGLILTAIFFGIFVFWLYTKDAFEEVFTQDFWYSNQTEAGTAFFWLAVISASYLMYRIVVFYESAKPIDLPAFEEIEKISFQMGHPGTIAPSSVQEALGKGKKTKKINIADNYTLELRSVIEDSYMLAYRHKAESVSIYHVLYTLYGTHAVRSLFIRLGVHPDSMQKALKEVLGKSAEELMPDGSAALEPLLFRAYEMAFKEGQKYVRNTELLLAVYEVSEPFREMLLDAAVDEDKVDNMVSWIRTQAQLRDQYRELRKAGAKRSKHGIDRAMTAVATPFLNRYSKDITMSAKFGYLYPCMAREKEINDVFRVIEAGRQSVLLVGEHGVGKKTIIDGIAQLMVEDKVPTRLNDKRLVQLSVSQLLAGTTVSGAQERLIIILNEVAKAGNVILFIDQIHNLIGGSQGAGGFDVSGTLVEYLGSGNFLTISTTTPAAYQQLIANGPLSTAFTKVEINPLDDNGAIQALESKINELEYKHHIFFSYNALEQAVKLANRFMHDQMIPESALEIITETASYVNKTKGADSLVTGEDIATIVSQKTGVPTTSISTDEASKLLSLEQEMHKRVIGQDDAVSQVANALRRARAELRSTKKPIATFLFLGPTGVGKTELAKTIAKNYFGGEDRMIRIDMSEYQEISSINRLIGQPGQQGTGQLTEAVHNQPFSLVLLDELEKAHPDILNLFLQVFDDGRLTDSVGRVIDFTNTIIISTSNAATQFVEDERQKGTKLADIREKLIRSELKQYYRPEFLNRFDGIVLFKSLERGEIKQIAGLMLKRLAKDLDQKGIILEVEDAALEYLSQVGFDPQFGARPMRRAIQEHIENNIAELLLKGEVSRRDTIVLGENAKPRVVKRV